MRSADGVDFVFAECALLAEGAEFKQAFAAVSARVFACGADFGADFRVFFQGRVGDVAEQTASRIGVNNVLLLNSNAHNPCEIGHELFCEIAVFEGVNNCVYVCLCKSAFFVHIQILGICRKKFCRLTLYLARCFIPPANLKGEYHG